jgi:hypothetical protein
VPTTEYTNPNCPDFASHQENAAERLYPHLTDLSGLSADEFALIDAAAEAEYRHCEGH